MAKISQSDAEMTARKIAEPYEKKITEAATALKKKMTEIYSAHLPPEIVKLYKKHSEYFSSTSSCYVSGHGFKKSTTISLIHSMPYGANYNIELTAQESKELLPLYNALDDLKTQRNVLQDKIESTILNLGTHARVKETFPEAYNLLPGINKNTGLSVPIAPLREEVRKLAKV